MLESRKSGLYQIVTQNILLYKSPICMKQIFSVIYFVFYFFFLKKNLNVSPVACPSHSVLQHFDYFSDSEFDVRFWLFSRLRVFRIFIIIKVFWILSLLYVNFIFIHVFLIIVCMLTALELKCKLDVRIFQ
jgi:hypothetical protein